MDICFVGEAWREKGGIGTQQRAGYVMGAGFGKSDRVVAYWKENLKENIRVSIESERAVAVDIGGSFVGAIYGATDGGREEMENWLQSLERVVSRQRGVLLGDWNTHCREWDEREDGKGKALRDWMLGGGFRLVQPDGATWCRSRDGAIVLSTIDLVWEKAQLHIWKPRDSEGLLGDHRVIWGELDVEGMEKEDKVAQRQVVDWISL